MAELLKQNPPTRADAPIVANLKRLGIAPGRNLNFSKLDPAVVKGLDQAVQAAKQQIHAQYKNANTAKNGWYFPNRAGDYGTHYLQRAFIAAVGLGATLPQDAMYPETQTDHTGHLLNGQNNYVMHFAAGQTPPVEGFWSLTLYNDQYLFAENALNRFSLSPRDHIKYNDDGSLDIYIQKKSPGEDKESNWLPAPKGKFILMLRLYDPKPELLEGKWQPPSIRLYELK